MGAFTQSWPPVIRRSQLPRLVAVAILTVLLNSRAAVAPASAQSFSTEFRLKAAFLFNFAQFVQWPTPAFASDTDPLVIAIVGRDPFDGNLEHLLDGKSVGGHPLRVLSISPANQVDLARMHAHLLFVARSEGLSVKGFVQQIRTSPILTVSEIPEFARLGGMIEVFEEDGNLHFEINRVSAEQAGLKLSSKLLALARITPVTIRRP